MSLIENLKVESLKKNDIIISWSWSESVTDRFKRSNLKTFIELFDPNDVLMRSITLSNPKSTKYIFNHSTEVNLKICLNISISEEANTTLADSVSSYHTCIQYTEDNWPSVPVSIGSSFAAFVVLLLIVCLIFITQRLGKKRRVMDKKNSVKRKPTDSYLYLFPNLKDTDTDLNDNLLLGNQYRVGSIGINAECDGNNSKLDFESLNDTESLDSISHGESTGARENGDYEIVKCDCGLIHLVGTEMECDDFLRKPVYYSPHISLAPQDTISIESHSSM